MAERLQGFFYSETGTVWLVKVFDSSYVGATTDFQCESIRFNWTPDEAENRFSPILSSECRLRIVVNNSTLQTFVDDLVGAEEGRFTLAVSNIVGLGNTIAWNGYVMPDLITIEDVPLTIGYTMEIRAKDGLNYLKNIDYNDNGTPYGGSLETDRKKNFVTHILNCINKLSGITSLYTNSQTILNTVCNWYEDSRTYSSSENPLIFSRIAHKAFYHTDSKGNYVFMSCYDVLKEICKAWGARIFFSGTAYWFVQYNALRAPTSLTVFRYSKTGSASTATGQDLTIFHDPASGSNELTRFSGGNFQFFPALDRVEVDYEHINTRNLIAGQVWDNSRTTSFTVNDIDDNSLTSSLVFNGLLSATSDYTGGAFNYHFLIFRFVINVGTAYLKRNITWTGGNYDYSSTNGEWENSLQYFYYVIPQPIRRDGERVGPITIAFETPANIQSGDLLFNFEYYEARFVTGSIIPSSDITVTYSLANSSLEFLFDGVLAEQNDINRYSADNDDTANQEYNVKTIIGDGPGKTTPTHIEIENDAAAWVLSDGWRVGNSGTYRAFSQLLVEEIISGQNSPVKRFGQASFQSSDPDGNPITPHVAISYDSAYWVFHQGSYDIRTEIMSGSWWKQQTGSSFTHNAVEFLPRGRETVPSAGGGTGGSGGTSDSTGSAASPTNLTFSGASSPVTLVSSTGSDVTFTAGTGISLAATGGDLTISASATSPPINTIAAATGTNDVNHGDNKQTWRWNSISSDIGLSLASNSTAANGNAQVLLNVALSGANANSSQITNAINATNSHSGAGSINRAGNFSASGGASQNIGVRGSASGTGARGVVGTTTASGGFGGDFANTATTGTNYGVQSVCTGSGATTNVALTLTASGATNNYALIVGSGNGSVGIGTSTPAKTLHVVGEVRLASLGTGTSAGTLEQTSSGDVIAGKLFNQGSVSDTTDGSGDVTVTHGLPDATLVATITGTGTTPYVFTVHTKGATTFKVRVFDMAGNAVLSTAVEFDWIARDI